MGDFLLAEVSTSSFLQCLNSVDWACCC